MARQQRRAMLTRLWIVAVLAWSVGRTFVVWRMLARYGVNPLAYGAVDLITSWPYAVATAGVVTSLLDGRMASARNNGLLAGAAFLAPDVYLLVAGHGKPAMVYAAVVTVAVVCGTLAVASIGVDLKRGRVARAAVPVGP